MKEKVTHPLFGKCAVMANKTSNSIISADAYDLLDCFGEEIVDIIREQAEKNARNRGSISKTGGAVIEREDVKSSVYNFITAVRSLINAGEVSSDSSQDIEQMLSCFHSSIEEDCD